MRGRRLRRRRKLGKELDEREEQNDVEKSEKEEVLIIVPYTPLLSLSYALSIREAENSI